MGSPRGSYQSATPSDYPLLVSTSDLSFRERMFRDGQRTTAQQPLPRTGPFQASAWPPCHGLRHPYCPDVVTPRDS